MPRDPRLAASSHNAARRRQRRSDLCLDRRRPSQRTAQHHNMLTRRSRFGTSDLAPLPHTFRDKRLGFSGSHNGSCLIHAALRSPNNCTPATVDHTLFAIVSRRAAVNLVADAAIFFLEQLHMQIEPVSPHNNRLKPLHMLQPNRSLIRRARCRRHRRSRHVQVPAFRHNMRPVQRPQPPHLPAQPRREPHGRNISPLTL